MLGNGKPALSGDAIEDPAKGVFGDARRDLRRIGELAAIRTNTTNDTGHGPLPKMLIVRFWPN